MTALIYSGSSKEEIQEWFEIEAKDLNQASDIVKDDIAIWVWTCGFLIDKAIVFDSVSDLYLASVIAKKHGLLRRKEQIEGLLEIYQS